MRCSVSYLSPHSYPIIYRVLTGNLLDSLCLPGWCQAIHRPHVNTTSLRTLSQTLPLSRHVYLEPEKTVQLTRLTLAHTHKPGRVRVGCFQPQSQIRTDLREQGSEALDRQLPWRRRVGDGSIRGRDGLVKLVRAPAMIYLLSVFQDGGQLGDLRFHAHAFPT